MSSIPEALAAQVRANPSAVAIRFAHLGLWEPTTWSELSNRVTQLAGGLASRGVTSGSNVVIVAANHPDWIAVHHAAISLGATVSPVSPDAGVSHLADALRLGGSAGSVVIAGDEEQYDKTIETGVGFSTLVVMNTRGMRYLDHQQSSGSGASDVVEARSNGGAVITMANLASSVVPPSALLGGASPALRRDGTTLSHATLLASAQRIISALSMTSKDRTYAQRNFSDPTEYLSAVLVPLLTGQETAIGSGAGPTVMFQELAQARPTALHVDGAWLTRLTGDIDRRSKAVKGLKRLALKQGWKPTAPASTPKNPSLSMTGIMGWVMVLAGIAFLAVSRSSLTDWWRFIGLIVLLVALAIGAVLAGLTVRNPLRRRYGLHRLRCAFASDGALQQSNTTTLGALGVPLVDVAGALANTSPEALSLDTATSTTVRSNA